MSIDLRSSLFIFFACFLWAVDLVVRYPVTLKVSFTLIVFFESLIGLLFISPWMLKNARSYLHLKKREWLMTIFIGGVGMGLAGHLQTSVIQIATPGLFSFFQIFQPVFVIYLAYLFLREKIDHMSIYWSVWVILSAVLMFSVDLGLMLESDIVPSHMLIAFSTMLIWGGCTILGKKFLENHPPLMLVSLRWLFAFIFSAVILLNEGSHPQIMPHLTMELTLRFLFMGVFAGLFSMTLYYQGLKQLQVGKVAFIEISYAALGMIFSALYTFDGLTFFQFVGAASFFIFLGIFLSRKDSEISPVSAM